MMISQAQTSIATSSRHQRWQYECPLASLVAVLAAIVLGALSFPSFSQTPLRIDITGVGQRQIPVAVAPFDETDQTQRYGRIVTEVVRADLARSGVISIVDAGTPAPALNERSELALLYAAWRQRGAEALVIGSSAIVQDGRAETRFILLDTRRNESLGGLAITTPSNELEARRTGHRIADFIYEKLTGEPGFFATRLAFVRKDGEMNSLVIADSDGQNSQVAMRSREPVISLAWSPDGTRLAYVSFEQRDGISKPVVYVHTLTTGRRVVVANERGSNSAPAWSPDGKRLAVVLTRDGNSQIYTVSAEGGPLTRLSRSRGIDTEPTFSPDGQFIYFTSDRGGSAQVYRAPVSGGEPQRVTFNGPFNARPQVSPDGKTLAYVTRREKLFRIAVLDLGSQQETVVSAGPKDDSPSFAPNSKWIIYSSRSEGKNVLSAVSLDGKLRTRLSAEGSEVKSPACGRLP